MMCARKCGVTERSTSMFSMIQIQRDYELTCFEVIVAWARKKKLATVKVMERYELNERSSEEPDSLVRK